jgi:pyrophosphatase PpaX
MRSYRCYLFDADGTLIDTTELIYQCFCHSLKRFGKKNVSREQIVSNIGLTLRRQMELYLGTLTDARYDDVRQVHMNYQLKIYPTYLKAFPGVREGLESLKELGKVCGVVSSRMRETLTLYLQVTRLLDHLDILVTPEDTERHKPEPDPVLEALKRASVRREHALYVGDASFDIECGAAAGVDTALVSWSSLQLSNETVQPTHVVGSMEELVTAARLAEDGV